MHTVWHEKRPGWNKTVQSCSTFLGLYISFLAGVFSCLSVRPGLQAAPLLTEQSSWPFWPDWARVWKSLHWKYWMWVSDRKKNQGISTSRAHTSLYWSSGVDWLTFVCLLIHCLCANITVRREIDSLNERLTGDGQVMEGGDPTKGALKTKGTVLSTQSVTVESTIEEGKGVP